MFGDTVPPASPWCSIQMMLMELGEGVSLLRLTWKTTDDVIAVICLSCCVPEVIEGGESTC